MRGLLSKVTAVLSAAVMSVTLMGGAFNVHAYDDYGSDTAQNSGVYTDVSNQFSVEGENSFGNLFSSEISKKYSEQLENNGCNVFSVEMTGKTASVSFETSVPATLVVGIYSESGDSMLASGSVEVLPEETEKTVTIDIESMPQYFYVKAYLVETVGFYPLCTVYENPNYTREMQEFFAKTTDDFDADRVLNLDDDKTNNFAVYGDSTKVIPYSEGVNVVASADDKSGVYVIENIDGNISSLQPGDTFAYKYGDGLILIVKVANISVSGTTAVITGADTSMENVFDYVKISAGTVEEKPEIDQSLLEEGCVYDPTVQELEDIFTDTQSASYSTEYDAFSGSEENLPLNMDSPKGDVKGEVTFGFRIKEKEIQTSNFSKVKFNGGVAFSVSAGIEFDLTPNYKHIEINTEYGVSIQFSVTGSANEIVLIDLAKNPLVVCNVAGLIKVTIKPAIIAKPSVEMSIKGTYKGGTVIDLSSGASDRVTNKSEKVDYDLKFEGEVFLGFSLRPELEVIHESIASIALDVDAGVKIVGGVGNKNVEDAAIVKHLCSNCITGEVFLTMDISYDIQFVKSLYFKDSILSVEVKIRDWYYSPTYGELAMTTCPHKLYRTQIGIYDSDNNRIVPDKVTIDGEEYTTDDNGKLFVFLAAGVHKIEAEKAGYKKAELDVKSGSSLGAFTVHLRKVQDSVVPTPAPDPTPVPISGNVKQVSLGSTYSAAIAEDGSLYMWGHNYWGQLGNGTTEDSSTPIKVLDNVASVSLGADCSAAITTYGSLYMWGENDWGQLGNGTNKDSYTPIKILDNVASVGFGDDCSAAITTYGSLYMWGANYYGQLGNSTTKRSYTPIKILDNVYSVNLGLYYSAAITKDGSLYMWGHNCWGQLGNGTTEDSSTPMKVLDNVASVSLGSGHSAAITTDGSLYMWGQNVFGQLGNGTNKHSFIPIKILDNVASVSLGDDHSAAITTDGSLYMWGANYWGELGNGKPKHSYTPVKILDNVASVSLGDAHSAAITTDRGLYMWGRNLSGEVGNGTTEDSYTPIKVLDAVASITLGSTHSAAITTDGSLYMWGSNSRGKLGNGTNTDSSTPIQITLPTATATSSNTAINNNTPPTKVESVITTTGEAVQTAQFTGLIPNDIYNVYAMKSKTAADALGADNLLFIGQKTADGSGNLTINIGIDEFYPGGEIFARGATKRDISAANVTIPDLSYTGTEQIVSPTVTLDGRTLTEGVDYMLCGDYSAVEVGTYTVEIVGMGGYCGSVSVSYNVIEKQETPIEAFVERLYLNILNRPSDPSKVTHIDNLNNGESACKVAFDFVFSSEFAELPISNEERVRRMYLTFLNREPDPAGLADWTAVLDNGCSIGHIFYGFTQSNEFTEICEAYGINRGTWEYTENRDRSSKLTAFVSRLYTKAMGRAYDVNGLNDHTGTYLENRDLYQLAYNFIFSQEFIEKNLSDEDFVDVMYRTFFDREGDPDGRADWLGKLKSGMSREEVLAGFVGSQECAELVARFGI